MKFFNRKRKRALRTPDNYSTEQMTADHTASTALFFAASGYEPANVDEQEKDADASLTDDDIVNSDSGYHPSYDDNVSYSDNSGYDHTDVSTADSGSAYDAGSSGYDSSSYDSGSYDSGGSYDAGSY